MAANGDTVTIGRRDSLAPRYRVRRINPDGMAVLRSLATGDTSTAPAAMLMVVEVAR
jgi:hypothetical protein